jgi:hypothetical protein
MNNFEMTGQKHVEKSDEQIQTPCTNIHHRSFSWIDTGTSIKGGGVRLALSGKIFSISEKMNILPFDELRCLP